MMEVYPKQIKNQSKWIISDKIKVVETHAMMDVYGNYFIEPFYFIGNFKRMEHPNGTCLKYQD